MRGDQTPTAARGEAEVPAVDGRVPGRRGRQTRDRLLTATARLLATRSYRELKAVDIAREVGTSPATFYQYFPGVEAAVRLLAQRVAEEGHTLAERLVGARWHGADAWETAEGLVDAFVGFWHANGAVLRVVDLAIVEGDERFDDVRATLLGPVTDALAAAIAAQRDASAATARAEAAVLVSMLAHVAEHQEALPGGAARLDDAKRAVAEHLHWGVTGDRPDR